MSDILDKSSITAHSYTNGVEYKYKNKRVEVFMSDRAEDETMLYFKRLIIVEEKDRKDLKELNGLETTIIFRPYSKYVIIMTRLYVSLASVECLHHGIGEVMSMHALKRKEGKDE